MAGSTGRERELACIKKLAEDHCGCSAELASALHEIRMDGPKKEEEIASRFSGQDEVTENCRSQQLPEGLCLAPFGKKFAQIWLQRYGRRFRVYKERRDRGVKRGHRQFSEAHLVSQQRHGRDLLVEGKGADKELLGQGLSKANVAVPATDRQKRYRFSEVLGQFRKTTEDRAKEKVARNADIHMGANPYTVQLRTGNMFNDCSDTGMRSHTLGRQEVKVLSLSSGLPAIPGAKVLGAESLRGGRALQIAKSISILVVDKEEFLTHPPPRATTYLDFALVFFWNIKNKDVVFPAKPFILLALLILLQVLCLCMFMLGSSWLVSGNTLHLGCLQQARSLPSHFGSPRSRSRSFERQDEGLFRPAFSTKACSICRTFAGFGIADQDSYRGNTR